jgi:chromosome segregation ATPase
VELLEKQLQMLVAQVEAGEETKASSEPTQSEKKANGTAHADRIDALTTRVSVLTAELERQKTVAARATNAMHEKTMEASEWRKKCDKAVKIAAAAADKNARGDGAGGVGAVSGDYTAYVYGALLGASAVAIIGYGALSYSMRAAR